MSMNRINLIGRLTKDPEMRVTPNGTNVTSFTLAVNRSFAKADAEVKADFFNCVAWKGVAENVANYLNKGSLVGVDGRLQTRSYQNQNGQKVWVTEIIAENVQFLETKSQSQNQGQGQNQGNRANSNNSNYNQSSNQHQNDPFSGGYPIDISDDDLPF